MNFLDLYTKPNLVAAHRGDRSCAPENTLRALRQSVGRCDFIEIDVQLSSDGIPVIIHDDTLRRTTDIADIEAFASRAPWRVKEFTFAELCRLDFGSWFYRDDPFAQIKAGRVKKPEICEEGVLTLEAALHFAKEQNIFLNVEMKDMHASFPDEKVVETVVGMIKQMQSEPWVLLSSFYHPYLKLSKVLAPTLPTAALQEDAHPDELVMYLASLCADAYNPEESITGRGSVEKVRNAGFFVNVYTVNDPKRQNELFGWGVNAVFTDFLRKPCR